MADTPRVLIIADDLTGAMDAAGPFASHGLPTWVAALPDECDPARFAKATVVSVNTESRNVDAAEATRRVEHAFRQVGGENFSIVVKKVDSTLRGHVIAETKVLAGLAHRDRLICCPAFPAQGRVMRDGRAYVHGVPLESTPFASDVLSPALVVPLAQAFAQSGFANATAVSAKDIKAADIDGPCALVVNAESDADLDSIAALAMGAGAGAMFVGSAGLTGALARALAIPGLQPEAPAVLGRIVYVVGSRSEVSRTQVATLVEEGARLLEAVNGRLRKEPVLSPGADVVLVAVPDKQGQEGDAQEVAKMLARHALRLVGPGNAQAIVATGGDTAIAFLRTSGNPALSVGGELVPGIAYARFMMGTRAAWLVTKAGGFGSADTLAEIGKRLRAGARVSA